MNFFLLLIPRLPRSRLFPYTTLFRSARLAAERRPAAAPDDRTRAVAGPRAAAARRVLDRRRPGHDDAHRRSEEHTSELQSQSNLVCRLLLEKKTAPRRACRTGRDPRR